MKYEWRKQEKHLYLPKATPQIADIPPFKFLTIKGAGNPNEQAFQDYISALYAVSYAIKMNLKKRTPPRGYQDYTVYPLEGVWDINEEARKKFNGRINKDDLVFTLMIRQPDFVSESFAAEMKDLAINKKPNPLLKHVKLEQITEGKCIQMMHIGSYDSEPESFRIMEAYATENNLKRTSKIHREIYITDFRKVSADKLKTVLRFNVNK